MNLSRKYLGLGLAVGVLAVYGLASFISDTHLNSARTLLGDEIQTQEARLTGLSTLLRHGGGTTIIDSYIADCAAPDRARFDNLLSRIETLNRPELSELRGLFADCADYFAKRRTAVFHQFEREVEVWQQMVDLSRSLGTETLPVDNWSTQVEQERTRMNVLNSLVRIQGEIIEALYDGEAKDSDRLRALLDESMKLRAQLVPSGV